jgi:hypothetical protein
MSISPDLFNSVDPPGVWITLQALESGEHDFRSVTLRIKPTHNRSVVATVDVSRYTPEHQVLQALAAVLERLGSAQAPVTRLDLLTMVQQELGQWCDPF